jgi:hypothetical protein
MQMQVQDHGEAAACAMLIGLLEKRNGDFYSLSKNCCNSDTTISHTHTHDISLDNYHLSRIPYQFEHFSRVFSISLKMQCVIKALFLQSSTIEFQTALFFQDRSHSNHCLLFARHFVTFNFSIVRNYITEWMTQ